MDHSVTIGRFVTSWGESTFIPIGMNGLTTNAVDLSKLRNPGASIKEALIPTIKWYVDYFNNHVKTKSNSFEEPNKFFTNI